MDSRIPVRFGALDDVPHGAALLLEGDMAAPAGPSTARFEVRGQFGHPIGCACCVPRGPVAEALSRLFLARTRGEAPLFGQVLVVTASSDGRAAVVDAIAGDMLTRARFRMA
ncbi:MAG: hypothetical protein ABI224_07060 [Acetobacteraceae bacterium]